MKMKMKHLLSTLIEDLINKSNKGLKWRFNFSYRDDSLLVESYSSEIKINDKLTGIRINKTYRYNIEFESYDISITVDALDFSGYLDLKLKSRLQFLVDSIEKNSLISMYPFTVQKLIDFNLAYDKPIERKSLEEINKTGDESNKEAYFVYFSSRV